MPNVPTSARGGNAARDPLTRRGLFGGSRPVRRLGDHGRYHLENPAFRLPVGTVWAALDGGTGRRLSILVFEHTLVGSREARGTLRSRLRTTPQIAHPHVVVAYYAEVAENGPSFMTMEALAGETLGERLAREGSIPDLEATELGEVLAGGVAAAHALGVTHGGIGPDLVLLTTDGPKLLGFGVGDLVGGGAVPASPADDLRALAELIEGISVGRDRKSVV